MEWLSSEEKSRSMMPYLLDLPPLDQPESNVQNATITETKVNQDSKTEKVTHKEIDKEQ